MKKGVRVLIIIAAVIVTIAVAALIGWTAVAGRIHEYGGFTLNEGAEGGKVAIILDNSEYKDELARMIGSRLGLDVQTDGFGLQNIKEVNNSEYDAVIVMAPVYAGKLQRDVKKWIEGISTRDNIILFVTNGGQSEIAMPVDTVSSATPQMEGSKAEPVPVSDMADILIEKINIGN